MNSMTPAERKARHDARKRAAGLVPVLLWTHPSNKALLKAFAKQPPSYLADMVDRAGPPESGYLKLSREEIRKGIYEKHPDDVPFLRGAHKTQETDK